MLSLFLGRFLEHNYQVVWDSETFAQTFTDFPGHFQNDKQLSFLAQDFNKKPKFCDIPQIDIQILCQIKLHPKTVLTDSEIALRRLPWSEFDLMNISNEPRPQSEDSSVAHVEEFSQETMNSPTVDGGTASWLQRCRYWITRCSPKSQYILPGTNLFFLFRSIKWLLPQNWKWKPCRLCRI